MKRGEVYYIRATAYPTGSEISQGRPALIVSNDKNNTFSNTVEVVYLTSAEKKDLPTHVKARVRGVLSTVLCEQINTVSKAKIGEYVGELSVAEMQMVDIALGISIGINQAPPPNTATADSSTVVVERDLYKRLYEDLLKRALDKC